VPVLLFDAFIGGIFWAPVFRTLASLPYGKTQTRPLELYIGKKRYFVLASFSILVVAAFADIVAEIMVTWKCRDK